jgi:short-subunit dehydrogenase
MISIGGWVSVPYGAAYTASKFALRGFGQSLRAELSDQPNIHVCDVFPSFVDTPAMAHAANYTGRSLRPTPPLVDPEIVAERIVGLVSDPRPIVTIGSAAWMGRFTQNVAPEIRGRLMRRVVDFALTRADFAPETNGNLFAASATHDVDGGYRRRNLPLLLAAAGALGG